MKERGWQSNSAAQRQQYIKVPDHTVHIDKWSFGACWQAAHIKPICSGLWVDGFSLQTSRCRVGKDSKLLFLVILAHLLSCQRSFCPVSECCCYVHRCPNKGARREKTFVCLKCLKSIQVWKHPKSKWSVIHTKMALSWKYCTQSHQLGNKGKRPLFQ